MNAEAPGAGMSSAGAELEELLALMARLRDARTGCPWDRAQTSQSLAPYAIEEAYELADAIARGEPGALREELGDLLLQVVFHARLAEELRQFDFAAVARGIREKLVRRHPHVFAAQAVPAAEASAGTPPALAWEQQKAQERAAAGLQGTLAGVPRALPSLARAARLGRRAALVGFDWSDPGGVRAKIDEELAELDAAAAGGAHAQILEELGDLLFTLANWARHLQVNPEECLRAATVKFEQRFQRMERLAGARGLALQRLSPAQWEELWRAAKHGERGTQPGTKPATQSDASRD